MTTQEEMYETDPELLGMFINNANDLLNQVEEDLSRLDECPEEECPDLLNRVFRAVHTIKGESGFVSLDNIGHLAHSFENVLDRMRDRLIDPKPEYVTTLIRACDRLRGLVDDVQSSHLADLSRDIARLQAIIDAESGSEFSAAEVPVATAPPATIPVATAPPAPASVASPPAEAAPNPEPQSSAVETPAGNRSDSKAPSSDSSDCGRKRVLVVDDEPMIGKLVLRALKKAGVCADEVNTSTDALAQMRRNLYNVVICDLNMPCMSGLQLLPKLKAISPMTQIIMLTGDASMRTVLSSLEAGAFDFLPKTQNFDALVEPVQQALARADRWVPSMRASR